jgi:hypothetical protein
LHLDHAADDPPADSGEAVASPAARRCALGRTRRGGQHAGAHPDQSPAREQRSGVVFRLGVREPDLAALAARCLSTEHSV